MNYRLWLIGLCAFGLSACGVQAPLDDAYHWEDRTTKSSTSTPASSASSTSPTTSETSTPSATSEPKSALPTLEYLNIQDTTITVKIHR